MDGFITLTAIPIQILHFTVINTIRSQFNLFRMQNQNLKIWQFLFFFYLSHYCFLAPYGFKTRRLINEQGKFKPNEYACCKYQTDDQ